MAVCPESTRPDLSAVGPYIELLPKQMCCTCDSIATSAPYKVIGSGYIEIILFIKTVCSGRCMIKYSIVEA